MRESFTCGDADALVAYLYDESEPQMKEAIETHLVWCAACERQIEELTWTRRQLAVWTPPPAELGFQITDARHQPGSRVAEPRVAWWQAPLPAWAQAVAAVLVFGAGLSVGLLRDAGAPATSARTVAVDTPSRSDLTALENRLRAEVAQMRVAAEPAAAPPAVNEEAILKRVEALVAESEGRQRREFTLRSVELARDFEAQRRLERAWFSETLGQFQGVTGAEVRQQREAIDRISNYLVTVSQSGK
jgi:hypothetical protein